MEYIECSCYNTFYSFQNKHQIHWHTQSVKMLCAYEKSKHSESHEMGSLETKYFMSLLSLTTNLHSCSQQVSEGGQLLLVVLHGLGEVHEVVQIDRIVLSLLVEEVQVVRLVWKLKNQLRPIEVRWGQLRSVKASLVFNKNNHRPYFYH